MDCYYCKAKKYCMAAVAPVIGAVLPVEKTPVPA